VNANDTEANTGREEHERKQREEEGRWRGWRGKIGRDGNEQKMGGRWSASRNRRQTTQLEQGSTLIGAGQDTKRCFPDTSNQLKFWAWTGPSTESSNHDFTSSTTPYVILIHPATNAEEIQYTIHSSYQVPWFSPLGKKHTWPEGHCSLSSIKHYITRGFLFHPPPLVSQTGLGETITNDR
jgi:hypothetical protein